jgi:hypothetical protein
MIWPARMRSPTVIRHLLTAPLSIDADSVGMPTKVVTV